MFIFWVYFFGIVQISCFFALRVMELGHWKQALAISLDVKIVVPILETGIVSAIPLQPLPLPVIVYIANDSTVLHFSS